MTFVLGREDGGGPVGSLGHFLATDGSRGAPVHVDLDHPHVGLVVGKRGSGKSHTLGVLAEDVGATPGVSGVVVDPMGAFSGLASESHARVIDRPRVRADAVPPSGWCRLLDLDPASGPGALLWRAAATTDGLAAMRRAVDTAGAPAATRRAVLNHLELAVEWDVFAADGLRPVDLQSHGVTVLDTTGTPPAAQAAIVFAVARGLYDRAIARQDEPLPWLFVDESHAVTDTVAGDAIELLLTRGRHPGVSVVLATQRPSALPGVAISQADLLVSHRLTAGPDIDALARSSPTFLEGTLEERLPTGIGQALVVDDATESAVTIAVRDRRTPHGGDTPAARGRAVTPDHPETTGTPESVPF